MLYPTELRAQRCAEYAIFTVGDKQYHHSLRTDNRPLTERLLADKRSKLECQEMTSDRVEREFAGSDDSNTTS